MHHQCNMGKIIIFLTDPIPPVLRNDKKVLIKYVVQPIKLLPVVVVISVVFVVVASGVVVEVVVVSVEVGEGVVV